MSSFKFSIKHIISFLIKYFWWIAFANFSCFVRQSMINRKSYLSSSLKTIESVCSVIWTIWCISWEHYPHNPFRQYIYGWFKSWSEAVDALKNQLSIFQLSPHCIQMTFMQPWLLTKVHFKQSSQIKNMKKDENSLFLSLITKSVRNSEIGKNFRGLVFYSA